MKASCRPRRHVHLLVDGRGFVTPVRRCDGRQHRDGNEAAREVIARRGSGLGLEEVVVDDVEGDGTSRDQEERGLALKGTRPPNEAVCPYL
jgi:hypothetical protein